MGLWSGLCGPGLARESWSVSKRDPEPSTLAQTDHQTGVLSARAVRKWGSARDGRRKWRPEAHPSPPALSSKLYVWHSCTWNIATSSRSWTALPWESARATDFVIQRFKEWNCHSTEVGSGQHISSSCPTLASRNEEELVALEMRNKFEILWYFDDAMAALQRPWVKSEGKGQVAKGREPEHQEERRETGQARLPRLQEGGQGPADQAIRRKKKN